MQPFLWMSHPLGPHPNAWVPQDSTLLPHRGSGPPPLTLAGRIHHAEFHLFSVPVLLGFQFYWAPSTPAEAVFLLEGVESGKGGACGFLLLPGSVPRRPVRAHLPLALGWAFFPEKGPGAPLLPRVEGRGSGTWFCQCQLQRVLSPEYECSSMSTVLGFPQ